MVRRRKVTVLYRMGDPNYEKLNNAIIKIADEGGEDWDAREFSRVEVDMLPSAAAMYDYDENKLPAMFFEGEKIYEQGDAADDAEVEELIRKTYKKLAVLAAERLGL
ncbi:MAG: hypothetical protein ACI4LM_06665 [Anaerovoracaceae bacterium]|jgi:hypothetical protein